MRIAVNNYTPIGGSPITVDGSNPYLWFPFRPTQVGNLKNIYLHVTGLSGGPTIRWRLHDTMPSSPSGIAQLPVVASGEVTPTSAGLFIQLNSSPLSVPVSPGTVLSLTLFRQSGTSFTLSTGSMSPYLPCAGLRPMVTRFYRSADGVSYSYLSTVAPWSGVPVQLEITNAQSTLWDLGSWHFTGYGITLSSTSVLSAASFRLPEAVRINGLRLLAVCSDTITGSIQVEIRPLQPNSFYPEMSGAAIYSYTLSPVWLLTSSTTFLHQVYVPFDTALTLHNFAAVFRLTSGTSNFALSGLGDSATQPISRYNNTMRIVSSTNGGSSWSDNLTIPVAFFDSDDVRLSADVPGVILSAGFRYIT